MMYTPQIPDIEGGELVKRCEYCHAFIKYDGPDECRACKRAADEEDK